MTVRIIELHVFKVLLHWLKFCNLLVKLFSLSEKNLFQVTVQCCIEAYNIVVFPSLPQSTENYSLVRSFPFLSPQEEIQLLIKICGKYCYFNAR